MSKLNHKGKVDSSSDDDEKFVDAKGATTMAFNNNVDSTKPDNDQIINELINKHGDLTLFDDDEDDEDDDKVNTEETFTDCQTDLIDEESQKDFEKELTVEERLENKQKSDELKVQGNEAFKSENYEQSIELYTAGLKICPLEFTNERSILYANRAASKTKLGSKEPAIEDCSKSIEYNPKYIKALLR